MPFDTVYSHSNPRTRKLSEEDRRRAVALYEGGWKLGEIATDLKVSPSAVSYHLSQMTVLFRDRSPAEREALRARRRAHRGGSYRGRSA